MNKKINMNDNAFKTDFPFFKNNPDLVYLDTAASSLKPQIVIDAVRDYYEKYCINPHSQDYQLAVKGNDIFEDTRKTISKFIKAFLPLCTIFKFYHINAEKSLSTDFSPHF
ncbi:aminotransferase class V-fold PLP-dependent enzyme [Spiroplasma endosymbiont of Zeiraphera isertana]|uniref:aminotransferase class V-fold PLP-dependent enzyme n=1 Tax=Spiroplasma endosymbiont of Zeiraphera isertana TaxID=3066313 RepID=UPI00313BB65A